MFEENDIETLKRLSTQLFSSLITVKEGGGLEASQPEQPETENLFKTTSEENEEVLEMPSPITFEEIGQDSGKYKGLLPIEKLERPGKLSQQFSEELLLANKGSDEGLLPIYSLLKEFEDTFAVTNIVLEALQPVIFKMDHLLDTTGILDEAAIRLLTEFNIWLESSLTAFTEGFMPVRFEAPATAEAAAPAKPAANQDKEDDLVLEFSEFDIVMDLNIEEINNCSSNSTQKRSTTFAKSKKPLFGA